MKAEFSTSLLDDGSGGGDDDFVDDVFSSVFNIRQLVSLSTKVKDERDYDYVGSNCTVGTIEEDVSLSPGSPLIVRSSESLHVSSMNEEVEESEASVEEEINGSDYYDSCSQDDSCPTQVNRKEEFSSNENTKEDPETVELISMRKKVVRELRSGVSSESRAFPEDEGAFASNSSQSQNDNEEVCQSVVPSPIKPVRLLQSPISTESGTSISIGDEPIRAPPMRLRVSILTIIIVSVGAAYLAIALSKVTVVIPSNKTGSRLEFPLRDGLDNHNDEIFDDDNEMNGHKLDSLATTAKPAVLDRNDNFDETKPDGINNEITKQRNGVIDYSNDVSVENQLIGSDRSQHAVGESETKMVTNDENIQYNEIESDDEVSLQNDQSGSLYEHRRERKTIVKPEDEFETKTQDDCLKEDNSAAKQKCAVKAECKGLNIDYPRRPSYWYVNSREDFVRYRGEDAMEQVATSDNTRLVSTAANSVTIPTRQDGEGFSVEEYKQEDEKETNDAGGVGNKKEDAACPSLKFDALENYSTKEEPAWREKEGGITNVVTPETIDTGFGEPAKDNTREYSGYVQEYLPDQSVKEKIVIESNASLEYSTDASYREEKDENNNFNITSSHPDGILPFQKDRLKDFADGEAKSQEHNSKTVLSNTPLQVLPELIRYFLSGVIEMPRKLRSGFIMLRRSWHID